MRHALHALREQVRTLHDSLHRALRQLRPLVLDNYGLRRALSEGPLRELAEDAGLDYRTRFQGDVDSLDEDTTTAIYRVCQEAITNCVRHARARLFILDLAVHRVHDGRRSEEHTSELQSLMRISYAVFGLKKKQKKQ